MSIHLAYGEVMAVFSGINNTNTFDPGFSFPEFIQSVHLAEADLDSLVSYISTPPDSSGQYSDGSVYMNWGASGTYLWAKGSVNQNTGMATLNEMELTTGTGLGFGFIGKGVVDLNTGMAVSVSAKEIWIDTPDDYGIAYRGSLNFDIATGLVSGGLKELYMLCDNGGEPGDAFYVKLSGSVTMDGNGNFTAGTIKAIEWGNVTFGEGDSESTFVASGQITGLKIDATQIEAALENDFVGLMSLAYGGNDKIDGTAGDDVIEAGAGNDKVDGGAGDDYIDGGEGNDKITDLVGNNQITDLDGTNSIVVGSGNDWVLSGAGNDKIDLGGADAAAPLYQLDGSINDFADKNFAERSFHNILVDLGGNNKITAGDGDDYILTDANPRVTSAGNNKIVAGDGDNVIRVGDGNNGITAGSGDDVIWSGTGNNKVVAGDGDNVVDLGLSSAFESYLESGGELKGNGNNNVTTGSGNDYVSSWEGNDVVKVGLGADEVNAGSGKNTIDLGKDLDADEVWFDYDFFAALLDGSSKTLAFSTVSNFNEGDTLVFYSDLDNDSINDLATLTAEDFYIASGATPADAGGASVIFDTKSGKLYYDADGAGEGAALQIGLFKGTGLADATFFSDESGHVGITSASLPA